MENRRAWWILVGCVCAFVAMLVIVSQAKKLSSSKQVRPVGVLASPAG